MGEKLPLEGTLGFLPLQTIYMHKNLYNTLQERGTPKNHNRAPLTCFELQIIHKAFNVCMTAYPNNLHFHFSLNRHFETLLSGDVHSLFIYLSRPHNPHILTLLLYLLTGNCKVKGSQSYHPSLPQCVALYLHECHE